MAREIFEYLSDRAIIARAPRDSQVGTLLNDAAGVVSCTFRVYDPSVDDVLSAAFAGGAAVLTVSNVSAYKVGRVVELTPDSGTREYQSVASIQVAANTITVGSNYTGAAAVGSRVRQLYGALGSHSVAMAEFGTASVNNRAWGYRGNLPSFMLGFAEGVEIDVEIEFVGGAGGLLDRTRKICGILQTECSA